MNTTTLIYHIVFEWLFLFLDHIYKPKPISHDQIIVDTVFLNA